MLCDRPVSRRRDKGSEFTIGHGAGVDPESGDNDGVDRRFLRIGIVGTHAKRTAGDPTHRAQGGLPPAVAGRRFGTHD